ncbi:hypothetical protein T439DRAFT_325909 [Meredithblackwellia eburnea MCA 4105]
MVGTTVTHPPSPSPSPPIPSILFDMTSGSPVQVWSTPSWPSSSSTEAEIGGGRDTPTSNKRPRTPLTEMEEAELLQEVTMLGSADPVQHHPRKSVYLLSGRQASITPLEEEGLVLVSLPNPSTSTSTASSSRSSSRPPAPARRSTHRGSFPPAHHQHHHRGALDSPPTPRANTPQFFRYEWFPQTFANTILGPLIVDYPWGTTPLGPITSWPSCLLITVSTMLSSPFREYIAWGDEFHLLYNDQYLGAAQSKHPAILGIPTSEAFGEAWSEIGPFMRKAYQGEIQLITNEYVPLVRDEVLQETYHTYSYTPIRDETGKVRGLLNRSFETTAQVVGDRRQVTVRDLVHKTSGARTVESFCKTSMECVSENPQDLPFFMLYTGEMTDIKPKHKLRDPARLAPVDAEQARTQMKLTCRGSVGIPESHPFHVPEAAVELFPTSATSDSTGQTPVPVWAWPFDEALASGNPVLVGGVEFEKFSSTLPSRAWGETPRQAVVVPVLADAGSSAPQAFLIIGLNPRNVFGEGYNSFTQIVARHVGIGLLAVTNAEADAKRNAVLVALDKAKSTFFSSVSHELRTPLTLILGPLEDTLADQNGVSTEVRERLDVVNRNANRLLTMVNKLLDFSALEAGRQDLVFQPVELGPFTADLASLFRDAIERGGLTFSVDVEDDPPFCLPTYISRDLYTHVLFNLLGNSLKYTPKGSIEVRIRSTKSEVVLEIEDTGVGIPPNELGNIFERFHRIESTANTTAGSGIGLALTLEMVKTQGGLINVESELGKGSTFSVTFCRGFTHLPAESISHQPWKDQNSSPGQVANTSKILESELKEASFHRENAFASELGRATGTALPSPGLSSSGTNSASGGSTANEYFTDLDLLNVKNSTIVLADDNPDLRQYVASLLSKMFNVQQFSDGQAALDYCLQQPPALVVTDVMMPILGGDGLLDALRSNPTTALVPVIFLSAQAGVEARSAALERGADDYLVKPFQSRELLARVRTVILNGKMRMHLESKVNERTAELNDSEYRYRSLAQRYATMNDVSPVGIFMMDSRPSIVYTNPRWHEITGHPSDRPLIQWKDVVEPEDLPRLVFELEQAISGQPHGSIQYRYRATQDRDHQTWVQLELRRSTEFGPEVTLVGTITDITRQKQMEELHIETVTQRAEDSENHRRDIEAFIDITSHELRNPLSGVTQNAEIVAASLRQVASVVNDLRLGKIVEQVTLDKLAWEMNENLEGMQAILICAAHQTRIADDILNVSKLNMGLLTVNRTSFHAPSKIREVLKMFEADCGRKGITLQLALDPSLENLNATWIDADPARLAQALTNFTLNAMKFTPAGGKVTVSLTADETAPPPRPEAMRVGRTEAVDLSAYKSPVWVSCIVQDTGRGLTSAEMQRLFERFSQAKPSDQYGGSGLGLYINKAIVELHSGFIEVDSTPGKGSRFAFSIPVERSALANSRSGTERPPLPSYASSSLLNSTQKIRSLFIPSDLVAPVAASIDPTRAVHVLVVEDNSINQKVLKRQLTNNHYEVTLASNGQEALDILQASSDHREGYGPIDVVLMDIEMPVMGGLEAIRELRAREISREIKTHYGVIAVTGNARQEQIAEYMNAGFNDTTIKPYQIQQLLEKMERITGRPAAPPAPRSSSSSLKEASPLGYFPPMPSH